MCSKQRNKPKIKMSRYPLVTNCVPMTAASKLSITNSLNDSCTITQMSQQKRCEGKKQNKFFKKKEDKNQWENTTRKHSHLQNKMQHSHQKKLLALYVSADDKFVTNEHFISAFLKWPCIWAECFLPSCCCYSAALWPPNEGVFSDLLLFFHRG